MWLDGAALRLASIESLSIGKAILDWSIVWEQDSFPLCLLSKGGPAVHINHAKVIIFVYDSATRSSVDVPSVFEEKTEWANL